MAIQKVFQAGNSQVVAIPKDLVRELGFRVGHKVVMTKTPDGQGLVVMRVEEGPSKKTKAKSNKEFDQWLAMILEEDKDLIQELAKR